MAHSKQTLDPTDWHAFRSQAHVMLDDMLDYLEHLRQRPVWQPVPEAIHQRFREPLPREGRHLTELHQRFLEEIMPYSLGNAHPGFMGWVQGGGTPLGMLADMLAAGLNANVGGREQIPISVERQILQWMRDLFEFPVTANGVFVTGTSIANFIAVLIARSKALGVQVRETGLAETGATLTAYTSAGAHGCVSKAMDMAGFGTHALRLIPMNSNYQIDLQQLQQQLATDRAAGMQPFLIIGSAGTVDVGAIDDLNGLADIAAQHGCWFHVDGAYGALGMFSTKVAPKLAGIQRAASIAFDFHKWGQVPYDAGYILVRDGADQLATFSAPANYLQRESRGMAAGSPWPCDLGPDLSRGFRALKTWFTIAGFGTQRLGDMIDGTCALAAELARLISQHPELELLAPVNLNIVCFRFRGTGEADVQMNQLNQLNNEIVIRLQEAGQVAPSSTILDGKFAIRAAIVNHRTTRFDITNLVESVLYQGTLLTTSPALQPNLN